jgi:hypothetical protein
MRELGRKGGRGRRSPLASMPSQERQSLRQHLREQVNPAEVWQALRAALESGSQTAVVSAARLLVTELYEERQDEDREAELRRANARAKQRLAELLAQRARVHEKRQIRDLLEEPTARLEEEAVSEHPDLVVGDVSPERVRATLDGLLEIGLLVPGHKVAERAEELAQERQINQITRARTPRRRAGLSSG